MSCGRSVTVRAPFGFCFAYLGAGHVLDEARDEAFDFGWRQIVASDGVRLAEVAADDEGAEAGAGEAFGLGGVEAADDLDGGGLTDTVEDGAGHVAEVVAFDEFGGVAAGVGLEVDADGIDAGVEHALGGIGCVGRGALVRDEDVGEGETRDVGVGAAEFVADGANGLGGIDAGEGEEVYDVAASGIDEAGLGGAAVHGLHVGQEEGFGKLLAEGGYDVGDAFVLEERRAHFEDVNAGLEGRSGDGKALRDGGDVDGDLEGVLVLELGEDARGGWVGLLWDLALCLALCLARCLGGKESSEESSGGYFAGVG